MELNPENMCETCGLANPEGKQDKHLTPQDCIRALRSAMLKQRLAAEQIGMDMSIHFLRALEELSIDPEVGVQYTMWDPNAGANRVLHGQQVSGVFAAILKKYREIADFSPHQKEKEVAAYWARMAGLLAGRALEFTKKYEVDDEDKEELLELIKQTEAPPERDAGPI